MGALKEEAGEKKEKNSGAASLSALVTDGPPVCHEQSKRAVVSDGVHDLVERCGERLEVDAAFGGAVRRYNGSAMYAWFQSTTLHCWLCMGRMYSPPMDHRDTMSQELSNHLFSLVEDRLLAEGITNPLAFNREYKRLAHIFHGTCVAYDKAYEKKDDELLSRALWRNLLNQDPDQWKPDAEYLDVSPGPV